MVAVSTPALALGLAGSATSSPASHAQLRVGGAAKLVDAPLGLRVDGLSPNEHVVVRVEARDAHQTRWRSQATFAADARGIVDPSAQHPLAGTYRGVHPQGLLWSMRPVASPRDNVAFWIPRRKFSLEITVSAKGRRVAGQTVTRLTMGPRVTSRTLRLGATGVYGRFYAPASRARLRPAVLLIGGSEGGVGLEPIASLLAAHGYPALSVAYFGEPGLPRGLAEIPLEYFATALRWLRRQPGVGAHRLVVVGGSRGSEAALLLAAHFPTLVDSVIALSPSNVSVGSFPGCRDPAWTLAGQPIPYQCSFGPNENTTGAAIPVRRIEARLLLVCGGADSVWPSCPMAHAIERERRGRGDVLLDYPAAGHGVGFTPNTPIWFEQLAGASPQANPTARERFWPHLLRFVAATPG
jgi:dienelactone hydrolase